MNPELPEDLKETEDLLKAHARRLAREAARNHSPSEAEFQSVLSRMKAAGTWPPKPATQALKQRSQTQNTRTAQAFLETALSWIRSLTSSQRLAALAGAAALALILVLSIPRGSQDESAGVWDFQTAPAQTRGGSNPDPSTPALPESVSAAIMGNWKIKPDFTRGAIEISLPANASLRGRVSFDPAANPLNEPDLRVYQTQFEDLVVSGAPLNLAGALEIRGPGLAALPPETSLNLPAPTSARLNLVPRWNGVAYQSIFIDLKKDPKK